MIYLTADHGGYNLKNSLTAYLKENGYEVSDEGPFELKKDDDYPDYVFPVIKKKENIFSRAWLPVKSWI